MAIKLDELRASDVGRRVTYTPFHGCDADQLEFGVITSFNGTYVFVRYGSNTGSQATSPGDLTWG